MILFGFCLIKDRRGIKIAFRVRRWERVRYIWKFHQLPPVKTPKMADPTMLTEVPTGKIFDVEDMDTGIGFEKPLEPEDI